MSYQVTYAEVLKATFVPPEFLLYLAVIGVPLFLIIVLLWLWRQGGVNRRHLWPLALALVIAVAAPLGASVPTTGAGWQLSGDGQLNIKAPPVTATLDLAETKAALTEYSGPWRPVRRTNGFGVPGMTTGWCRLANGEKAVVFRHQRTARMLVLESEGRYYVLAHPGVEELYKHLVSRGVRPGDF
ncbi:hypothetical protein [Candidatus Desulforudis audaxviator]|uniref:Bacterial Pleckstrin homology domain-containing protein n=1 Tax=Desulforudis audaxviator (strain MP104C) TaxID=477974 RepID=B1I1W1_DESAP|nr:hypothetical protein [Candidatus Desulforudis audaxviator]ACA58924.1 hypothetical protein Daud_0367 [Candidatus Desulforudis audaxviator MP104C]AZK58945.1 hypothetical protein Daudx_0390 [Candidatus Desulforudis audaxviator]